MLKMLNQDFLDFIPFLPVISVFDRWKFDLEKTSACSYLTKSGWRACTDGSATNYYHCNNSGAFGVMKNLAPASKFQYDLLVAPKMLLSVRYEKSSGLSGFSGFFIIEIEKFSS